MSRPRAPRAPRAITRRRTTVARAVGALALAGLGALGIPTSGSPLDAGAAPVRPTLRVVARDGAATLRWSDPSPAVIGYVVERSSDGVHFVTVAHPTTNAPLTLSGLVNGHAYEFLVIGVERAAGATIAETAPSPLVTAIPVGPPFAPLDVTATPGPGEAVVTFRAPRDNGGDLVLLYRVSGPATRGCTLRATAANLGAAPSGPRLSCVVHPLRDGHHYRFRVVAVTRAGISHPSAWSSVVTPGRYPSTPTGVLAVPLDQSVAVSWRASSGASSPVRRYVATATPGSETCVTRTITCTITGLTNQLIYQVTVRAFNALGASPASTPASATPAPVSSEPLGPFATGSAALTPAITTAIATLAQDLVAARDTYVRLTGYANDAATTGAASTLGDQRASAVALALRGALGAASPITITVLPGGRTTTTAYGQDVVVAAS
ncbi:MAG: fibronectin type III domain-containing protein [Acidimicrobiales bacterium]